MSLNSDYTFLGGVKKIKIDTTEYEVFGDDGVVIEYVADIVSKPVVGSAEHRVRVRAQHFVVQASLPENTLEALNLAWNQAGVTTPGGEVPVWDYVYLGVIQTLTSHTLEVTGYDRRESGVIQERTWHFNKVYSYDVQPQELTPTGIAVIPVRFICVADPTQASGQEFGYVKRPTTS